MKILIIANDLIGNNGWSRYSSGTVSALRDSGNIVSVLTAQDLGLPDAYLLRNSIFRKGVKVFSDAVKNFSPDVIHFTVEPYAQMLCWISPRLLDKSRVFLTVHGTYCCIPTLFEKHWLRYQISKIITRRMLSRINGLIAVSQFTVTILHDRYFKVFGDQLHKPVKVITNKINVADILDDSTHQQLSQPIILTVGDVKARKGIFEAVKAFTVYQQKYSSSLQYHIVGALSESDAYFRLIHDYIVQHSMQDSIVFHGKVSEVQLKYLYKNAHLFIMLSQDDGPGFEGFGLVYLEANAFGVPTIGAYRSGAQEAISHGHSGYLVNPHNANEVADKIHAIIDLQAISPEACRRWADDHDISLLSKELISFYNSV